MKVTKRTKSIIKNVDVQKEYTLEEAVKTLKETSKVKFTESLDCAVRLGVDPRHADQMVRGTVSLPHGTGKKKTCRPDGARNCFTSAWYRQKG